MAYSGGGDSLAALIATLGWARRAGRSVLALHVDHGLQPQSAAWADQAERTAKGLGADVQILVWRGSKPDHGLAAAARDARHRLVAEAARAAGAAVVVMGHTADDSLEADLMRAEGSSLGRLAEWRPSPVWPEGRDIFLLRPLLRLRRAEIRRRLAPLGLRWIEDPANIDPRSLRARARQSLGANLDAPDIPPDDPALADLARAAMIDAAGALRLDRNRLKHAPPGAARRFVSAALVCVAGGERPPRRARLDRLMEQILGDAPLTATLAGARVSADAEIRIAREAGALRRSPPPPCVLTPGQAVIWDGRFQLTADAPGAVRALGGLAAKLPRDQKTALLRLPVEARPGLPAIVSAEGRVTCPILADGTIGSAKSLIAGRLFAVCGAISKEPPV